MKKLVIFITGLLISLFCFTSLQAQDVTKMEWKKVVEQAKQEGSVTFNVWFLMPRWRLFVKRFEKEYGITVKIPTSTLDGNLTKMIAEKRKKTGKLDVVGFNLAQIPVVTKLNLLSSLKFLPVYPDAYSKLQAVDSNGYAVAFWGNQTGFAYDPLQMKNIKLPQTLDDVQNFIDNNPYKFGYNNPQFGGSGQAFIERILSNEGGEFNHLQDKIDPEVLKNWPKGWQWFQKNRDKIVLTGSQADSLTRMNDGEISLAPAWQDHLNTLQKTGAVAKRLKFYIPEFGMPSGGNFVGISKNAQHPAAAALFVNWLVSAKTQAELKEFAGSVPVNKQLTKGLDDDKKISFYSHAYSVELKKQFIVNR